MRPRDALPDPDVQHDLRELEAALGGEPTADPDLAGLVADVEAARPAPDAAFLASLDARVRAGFPTERATPPREPEPWHVRIRRPRILLPAAGLALAAGLAAVVVALPGSTRDLGSSSSTLSAELGGGKDSAGAAGGSSSSSSSASSRPKTTAPSAQPALATGSPSPAGGPSTTPALPTIPPSTTATDRKVQRAAELTLTPQADDVQDVTDGVVRETQAAGGYVQRSEIATEDGGGTASLTLRVPTARLDAVLGRLSQLAHVGALTQASTDITATTVSAADRLADARDERRALLRALGRATSDRQIASLKARLRDNRSQIAARKGALDAVRRRADLATVGVSVQGTDRPSGDKGGGAWTPRDALHDAGRVLEVAGGVALIALAVLAPLAVVAALAWLAARGLRRRRRETALDRTA
ncbi:MAG TPA: DUF4349 domain-containing protein [Baekduia sp.]|uniref:DUF4349 domain-containing protein n=1 Tax=Baekduia sp. TaxID=2600305 RepID=UPI002B656498|nr:DUF4349 domain-containing protein [Baekduia sp.]HMJ32687.1 DUF4349 domain-containing protein [Baekduia sp.]